MFKKEFFYTIAIFVCFEILTTVRSVNQFLTVAVVGLFAVLIWAVTNFINYSGKKVSKYTDEMMKIQFKVRWYQYFVVPVVFYLSIVAYIFYIKDDIMRQILILLGSFANYVLFVHTRITYEKIFALSRISKVAFDLINVIFFFVVSNVLIISGILQVIAVAGVLGLICMFILVSNLLLSREFNVSGLVISLIMSVIVFVSGMFFETNFQSRFSFLMTIVFYILISFWHIRMMGERKFEKYISPILFALMALILVVGK